MKKFPKYIVADTESSSVSATFFGLWNFYGKISEVHFMNRLAYAFLAFFTASAMDTDGS